MSPHRLTSVAVEHYAEGDHKLSKAIFEISEIRDTFQISYLTNLLIRPVYDEIKQRHDISQLEYLLLFSLSHLDELTAQEISDIIGRPRNSVSRAVHSMLESGFVTRSPHPTDGRQALLRITPDGRKKHEAIVRIFKQRQDEVLSGLTSSERELLSNLLTKAITGHRN